MMDKTLPLPLHALEFTLEFLDEAAPRFFHQAALSAFLRHLLDSPAEWDRLLVADAVESGHTAYQAGDRYRFSVTALPGGEALLGQLAARLQALPGSARRADRWMPLRDNLAFAAAGDLFASAPFQGMDQALAYDLNALDEEVAWWRGQSGPIRWRWLSPAQLLRAPDARRGKKGDARYCRDATHLDGPLLLTRTRDSVQRLAGGAAVDDANPPAELIEQQLFWVDFSYRDGEGREQTLGGLTGRATLKLSPDLDLDWWRCLVLGQYTGIGQRRGFGWGRYRLETADGAYRAPRARPAASLLAQAAQPANLNEAWAAIRANRSGQRDQPVQAWDEAGPHFAEDDNDDRLPDDPDLDTLGRRLATAQWRPPPLKVSVQQKPDGEPRVLSVPPFLDRVAQRAVAQVITPGLDTLMYAHSYGFRRGRSRLSARYAIQDAFRAGYRWVYESDVDDFFDSVNFDHLGNRLIALFGDDPLVGQIMAWIQAPLDYEGHLIERGRGLPQGAPLSPLLANLMLDDFDHDMEAAGLRLVRFADDFVILCKDAAQAEAAAQEARRSLAELGLTVNPDKTRIVPFDQGFRYLGYLFLNDMALDVSGEKPAGDAGPSKPPPAWLARIAQRPPQPIGAARPPEETPPVPGLVRLGERGDAGTLVFVTGESTLLATRQGRLHLERGGETVADIPWNGIQAVLIIGRHHITAPALQAALLHQVPIHFCTAGGHYQGVLWDGEPRTGGHDLWLRQQARFTDPDAALEASRGLVEARIRHLREVLRQHGGHDQALTTARNELDQGLRHLPQAADAATLNGLEGAATRVFFQAVKTILPPEWGFEGRNRRPPRDPFNALISLGYTVLHAQVESVLRVDGLLPWLGFYHQGRGRHAALASDLIEPFRHLVERTALNALQRRSFKPEEFTLDGERGCRLNPDARRRWLGMLVRRFEEPVAALDGEAARGIHEHLHRQNLALIDWIDGRAPFRCWRMR